jgi:hypothetical protein
MAMKDPTLFHVLLCGSALHKDQFSGGKGSLEMIEHMNEAIHLLNIQMQTPESRVSDATIYAIAHLADFEVSMSAGVVELARLTCM